MGIQVSIAAKSRPVSWQNLKMWNTRAFFWECMDDVRTADFKGTCGEVLPQNLKKCLY